MPSNRPDQRVDSTSGNSILLHESGVATNQGLWEITVTGSTLKIRTRTDANGTGVDILSVTRSGTGVTGIAVPLASIQSAADDSAAAALATPVPVGGLYRTASALKIRVA